MVLHASTVARCRLEFDYPTAGQEDGDSVGDFMAHRPQKCHPMPAGHQVSKHRSHEETRGKDSDGRRH